MGNLTKTGIVSIVFASMPLNVDANSMNDKSALKNQINIELSDALNNNLKNQDDIGLFDALNSSFKNQINDEPSEPSNFVQDKEIVESAISPQIITKAILDYFDEEVKLYKLSPEARVKVVSILNNYLLSHSILIVGNEGRMTLVIDNKKEFIHVVKQLVNVIIGDMPVFVRRIGIPLVFGGNDKLQEKLDNLENTVMNMKEKQYKDVVFDYVGGIVKRVAKSVGGKMTVKQYYGDISRQFPNKASAKISQELVEKGSGNMDIKNMEYPFKK